MNAVGVSRGVYTILGSGCDVDSAAVGDSCIEFAAILSAGVVLAVGWGVVGVAMGWFGVVGVADCRLAG